MMPGEGFVECMLTPSQLFFITIGILTSGFF